MVPESSSGGGGATRFGRAPLLFESAPLPLRAPLVLRGDGRGCLRGGDGDERSATGDKVRDFRVRGDRRGVFWLMRAGEWGNVTPPSEGG